MCLNQTDPLWCWNCLVFGSHASQYLQLRWCDHTYKTDRLLNEPSSRPVAQKPVGEIQIAVNFHQQVLNKNQAGRASRKKFGVYLTENYVQVTHSHNSICHKFLFFMSCNMSIMSWPLPRPELRHASNVNFRTNITPFSAKVGRKLWRERKGCWHNDGLSFRNVAQSGISYVQFDICSHLTSAFIWKMGQCLTALDGRPATEMLVVEVSKSRLWQQENIQFTIYGKRYKF